MELNEILAKAIERGASDIHLKHGLMPVFRINGDLAPMSENAKRLKGEQIAEIAESIMGPVHKKKFLELNEVDMSYGVAGVGRFRVNIFQQRGSLGMVLRAIPVQIKTIAELNLPPILNKIAAYERGLILVTGSTGSGKSSTLAAMIDFINANRNGHILTIEDPIEHLVRDRRCIVNQRELGIDTPSFSFALRQALRQDPDVIMIGEMRDPETMRTALYASETGHLVLSTLHTADTTDTIARIMSAFDPHEQPQIRLQVATQLKAVVSQRLVTRADGKGVVPACEVLINTARIKEMIGDHTRTGGIRDAIEEGVDSFGMQSFDQALMKLANSKMITADEAIAASSNPEDFALRLKGVTSMGGGKWEGFES